MRDIVLKSSLCNISPSSLYFLDASSSQLPSSIPARDLLILLSDPTKTVGEIFAPDIALVTHDCLATDRNWILNKSFDIPPYSDIFPAYYWENVLRSDFYNKERIILNSGKLIGCNDIGISSDERPFAFMQPNCHIYGHFILEALPRLLLAKHLNLTHGMSLKPVLGSGSPAFVFEYIRSIFGDYYSIIPVQHHLTANFYFLTSPGAINYLYHPMIVKLVHDYVRNCVESQKTASTTFPRKLLLLREGVETLTNRRPDQSFADCEKLFLDSGYSPINSHKLSVCEQISLFSRATHVASTYCSAVHNSIFSLHNPRIITFGCDNEVQACIAAIFGQRMTAYLRVLSGQRLINLLTSYLSE